MDYSQLDDLISKLQQAVEAEDPQKGYWKELWGLVRTVGEGFKGVRYPTRQEREEAWDRFQGIVKQAKARSEECRLEQEKSRKAWEERTARSESATRDITDRIARARPLSEFERTFVEAIFFPAKLVAKVLLTLVGIETPTQLEEIKSELLECNEALNEAWKLFMNAKSELLPGDKQQLYDSLQQAKEKLDEAWSLWKSKKSDFRQHQQREWETRQRNRELRQAEYEAKRSNFIEHVKGNISKLEDKLEKAKSALERQEAHLEKLRSDYEEAWNDSFKDRCSDWIDEAETRIESIKESIERLEGWISEEQEKIR